MGPKEAFGEIMTHSHCAHPWAARASRVGIASFALLSTCACGSSDENDGAQTPTTVAVEGDVLAFLNEVPGPRIVGAKVSVLEHPEMTVTTGSDAHFRFEGLEPDTDFTLLVEHPDLKTTQTATITLGAKDLQPFSVQVVPTALFDALAGFVPLPPEEDRFCVVASTVARTGGSLYVRLRQGMPDVKATLTPAVAAESGPIYFSDAVLPDTKRTTTSTDGGVLFYRVPPGDYVLGAEKADTVFNSVRLNCRAGVVVNAGPPVGLLANVAAPDYAAGSARPDDDYTAVSDAMCERTAACVNSKAKANNYPDSTLASCKAMFRNMWAWVDPNCDTSAGIREAARGVYACRAQSCAKALGNDDVCKTEEEAFRAAEAAYGQCVSTGP
jgi:hypothetical protein